MSLFQAGAGIGSEEERPEDRRSHFSNRRGDLEPTMRYFCFIVVACLLSLFVLSEERERERDFRSSVLSI